ncbi:MAG: CHRD domain-containing protein, partial [Actinomycetota bacterium]|nr:CHRD domain-containing protein [Actinomycetota bacterium]
ESAPPPVAGGRVYTATLGANGDPSGRGDPDGSGRAQVSLHSGKNLLCVALTTSGVAPVTSVHLHSVSPTSPDPVVATPAPDSSGSPTCVPVDAEVLRAIRKNPTHHYLDVHNDEFPNGALRGYLSRWKG